MNELDTISHTDPLIGTQVGEYQILEPIGEGGMGVVYRGVQPIIKKRVAIKVLKPIVANDTTQVKRLVAEAESVNAIGHRGIIDIFGLGQLPDGRPYIIMEFLEGEALDLWMHRHGRLPLTAALEILIEVCAPMGAAHRAGVIHRDLKPSNVFICTQADGTRFLKLLDFGLAKRAIGLDGSSAQTSNAVVSGTPDYMAPEQARGLSISPRSDIYALGVMAFELITGRVPFEGVTPMDVMVAHVSKPPPSLASLAPATPPQLVDLVGQMLSKRPEDRPQTIEQIRAVLEDVLVSLGEPRPRTSRTDIPRMARPPVQIPPELLAPVTPALQLAAPVPSTEMALASVKRSRAPIVIASAGLAVALAAAAFVVMRAPSAPVVTQPAPPPTPTPAPVAVAPLPTPAVIEPKPPEPVAVNPVVSPIEKERPRPQPAAPPTAQQLRARIDRLEARARKTADLDPTALQFLGKFRISASAADADSVAARTKLSRSLDQWEKSFLRK